MIKNIFLDRDGIVNEVVFRNGKIESPRIIDEFKIKNDFLSFYETIKNKDLNLFLISNQPDISRNLMEQRQLDLMTEKLLSIFRFNEIYYCIHDDKHNCSCRKPKAGMILNLMNKYKLKKEESIIIGDSWKDIGAGKNAGIMSVLLIQDYNKGINYEPDFRVNSLSEISNLIKNI